MPEDAAFANAKKIMDVIDHVKPWADIAELVVEDCPFLCQADALKGVTTVKAWYDWMVNFETNIAPGCKPIVHQVAWDAENKAALLNATFLATHSGDGGPLPATNKSTKTDYVYICKMNNEGKCVSLTKVWNDGYCLQEMGWA
jgi:hypothetical protein